MASIEPDYTITAAVDQRPTWPYEHWDVETVFDENDEESQLSHTSADDNKEVVSSDVSEEFDEILIQMLHKESCKDTKEDESQDMTNNSYKCLETSAYKEHSITKTEHIGRDSECLLIVPPNDQTVSNADIRTSPSNTEQAKHNLDHVTIVKEVKVYMTEGSSKDNDEIKGKELLLKSDQGLKGRDINEMCTDEAETQRNSDNPSIEEYDIYEPDHWTHELETDIPDSCPINSLIQSVVSPDISQTEEAQQIKAAFMPMLESTLERLTDLYQVFKDSYIMSVGSMAEHSKVGKADEFDFAVILPVLAREEYSGLLNKGRKPVTDPTILSMISDIWEGDIPAIANSFQHGLRELWSEIMMDFVPDDWTVLNPLGHSDSHSVAATFHLEKKSDCTRIDMDVCFWVPLNKENLYRFPTFKLPQKYYLSMHCLDENGLAYAIMPHDSNISRMINSVRFAMSRKERATLLNHGPENYRLICYRTCKSLVSALVPKVKKKEDCIHCFDSIISSYCLKNVVLYMAANYKEESYWTKEKLPNRVLEVFIILTFCMKVNACQVSAYFTPYQLSIDTFMSYEPSTKCVTDANSRWYDASEIPCILPNLTATKELFSDDPVSHKALEDYEIFLTSSAWRYPEVICRVTELLSNLAQIDENDRKRLTGDPGWNYFSLDLPKHESYVHSIDTKL